MTPVLEVQLIAVVAALACALPGVWLLLRRQALLSDAISHSVLLGIVLGYLWLGRLDSPWLAAAAALSGLAMVWLVELLRRSGRMKEDAALGLVFPVMFSLAVVLVTRLAGGVHLDTDAVLLGELAFAPFRRLTLFGLDLPHALWQMGGLLLANLLFLLVFWKELTASAFDPLLASALGFLPALLHTAELGLLSLTCVGAFDAVGSVLVVALVVTPGAVALLLSERLPAVFAWAALAAVAMALLGWQIAWRLDASIAGSMAVAGGVLFGLALLLSPEHGLVATRRRSRQQSRLFARRVLAIHLFNHEGTAEEERECRLGHLSEHLGWSAETAGRVVRWGEAEGDLACRGEYLGLTNQGRRLARQALEDLPLQMTGRGTEAWACPWPRRG
jgi:manganese/zinc/iron transport system permease protein